jgi:nitrate/TMAO reductase-like tetraheme cytochrome c subunit
VGDIVVIVREKARPNVYIENAVVRLAKSSGQPQAKMEDNTYRLQSCPAGDKLTAWAPSYFIAVQKCDENSGKMEYVFELEKYTIGDEARFWFPSNECLPCHNRTINDFTGREHNEFSEWQKDGHSTVLRDGYLRDIYRGNPGALDHYAAVGFRTDYPNDNGNCGYCHAPSAVIGSEQEVNMLPLFDTYQAPAAEGINCDVCHKVVGVNLSAVDGLPFRERPGILSYDLLQPDPQNPRLYVGSYVNANLKEGVHTVSCNPIFSQSEFCAPCHYAKFWDVEVYASYKEWLDSAYADPASGVYRTCQDCHMRPKDWDPSSLPPGQDTCNGIIDGSWPSTHNMLGRDDNNLPSMIFEAASVKVEAGYDQKHGRIQVNVTVTNDKVGHKFPTDSPLRHLILVVEAIDEKNNTLPQLFGEDDDNKEGKKNRESRQNGETIPDWIGEWWNPFENHAGSPGRVYAFVLIDEKSGTFPSAAYWNRTKPASLEADTRLLPKTYNSDKGEVEAHPDRSVYYFAAPAQSEVTVTATLWYRYAFKELAEQKNWPTADILVAQNSDKVNTP